MVLGGVPGVIVLGVAAFSRCLSFFFGGVFFVFPHFWSALRLVVLRFFFERRVFLSVEFVRLLGGVFGVLAVVFLALLVALVVGVVGGGAWVGFRLHRSLTHY